MTYAVLNDLWADRLLVAGLLGAALGVLAFLPYIRDILTGATQPDRACWLIWAVLASLSGASNFYEGATASLWFVGVQVGGTLVVFALSVRWGSGNIFSAGSLWVLGIAGLGIVSWAVMDTAAVALALSIGVSALGGARTVVKSYVSPDSETGSAWWILLASSAFGVASVGSLDPLLLAYPAYLFLLYAAIVGAGISGRAAQAERADDVARSLRRMQIPPLRRVMPDEASPRMRRRAMKNRPEGDGHQIAA